MYKFDMENIQLGDIILTAHISISSKAIRLATMGQFSHAILYVGYGSFIHSDSQGVHSNNIKRLLFENESLAEVRRLNDQSYCEKAVLFARSQIGTEYSIKEAISTKSHLLQHKLNRQFCSRLVAQSYSFAGIDLVENVDYCTPKELQHSQCVHLVNGCITPASEEDITFASSPSPIQRQTEITNDILSKVRQLSGKDIQSLEDLDQLVLDIPSLDKEVTKIVSASGYLTMWQFEKYQNPWRYDGEIFLSLEIGQAEKIKSADFELKSAEDQIKLYIHNFQMCQKILQHRNLLFFVMKADLYESLIEMMNKRIDAAKYVLKKLECD